MIALLTNMENELIRILIRILIDLKYLSWSKKTFEMDEVEIINNG
jgi:hypothetical protein